MLNNLQPIKAHFVARSVNGGEKYHQMERWRNYKHSSLRTAGLASVSVEFCVFWLSERAEIGTRLNKTEEGGRGEESDETKLNTLIHQSTVPTAPIRNPVRGRMGIFKIVGFAGKLDCSQSPIFPWDFRDLYSSVEFPPSWFNGEGNLGRVFKLPRGSVGKNREKSLFFLAPPPPLNVP